MVDNRSERVAARDLHFEVIGPAVTEMAEVFRDDWSFASGEVSWPPPAPGVDLTSAPGDAYVRALRSGPNEDLENLRWIILAALRSSRPIFERAGSLQSGAQRGCL